MRSEYYLNILNLSHTPRLRSMVRASLGTLVSAETLDLGRTSGEDLMSVAELESAEYNQ